MNHILEITLILLLTIALFAGAQIIEVSPRVELNYRNDVVGSDITTSARVPLNRVFTFSPQLFTYQTGDGWSLYDLDIRFDALVCNNTNYNNRIPPWRGFINLGITSEYLDLSKRNPSSSFTGPDVQTRFRPEYAIGVGIDSIRYVCQTCDYFFTGEIAIGNFIPFNYRFKHEKTEGETLSTEFIIKARTTCPLGGLELAHNSNLRDWYGEDVWQLAYTTPSFCNGLFNVTAGLETHYMFFTRAKINLHPILDEYPYSMIFGVYVPNEANLWNWEVGLIYEPRIGNSRSRYPEHPGGSRQMNCKSCR